MTCPVCTSNKLAPGRTVCPRCVGTLRGLLTDLPTLMEAATAAVGGRLRFSTKVGTSRSRETPVPVNLRASDDAYVARTRILMWTDHVAQARHETTPATWRGIQTFLDVRANWIAAQDAGPEAYRSLIDALRLATRSVDRPADRHYAGPCTATTLNHDGHPTECDGELYAHTDRPQVQCPRCGATYDTDDRRNWLLAEVWDAIAPGPDIARALAGEAFGSLTVNLSTLRRWASEGRLQRIDTHHGRPRYRLGDIYTLATGLPAPTRERISS